MGRGERGQSTIEYILVVVLILLVGVAVLAIMSGGAQPLYERARALVEPWLKRIK